ncbi:CxxxxCH/CxxCH domain-containing protein [Aeromonas allosaccharophila]|uniref:CxxxxCH/CxxCH domain-containing protein n=1 Tax=Aeromonas allosaccharophila TaxID=656 RepID=UPI0036DAA1F1
MYTVVIYAFFIYESHLGAPGTTDKSGSGQPLTSGYNASPNWPTGLHPSTCAGCHRV